MSHELADGPDTALARLLHGRGRLDVETLRHCLEEVRQAPDESSLAAVLIERGLIPAREIVDLLQEVPPRPDPAASDVFDAPTARMPSREGRPGSSEALTGAQPAAASASGRVAPPTEPKRALGPGARLGPWVLQEKLGAGGMGAVFLASSGEGNFAIKTLHMGGEKEDRERLMREIEAQGKFHTHRNVVRVRSWGEANGVPYLVADLAEGGSLHQLLREGPLRVADAVRIVRDVAAGLAHLHAHGVTHRDLKPGNILFDTDGTAKLVDFGLARFEGARSLTQSGTMIGTLGYLSPEQARGAKGGPPADVWALGCVLHTCLTCSPPFGHGIGSVDRILKEEPPPLTTAREDERVPEWLGALYKRLLTADPLLRPSAQEVARLFEAQRAELPQRSAGLSAGIVGLALFAGLGVGAAAVSLMARRLVPQVEIPAAPSPAGPVTPPPAAGSPPVSPGPRPAEAAAIEVWPVKPDQVLSVWLSCKSDLRTEAGRASRRQDERQYWFTWRVEAVRDGQVEVRARATRIKHAWTWTGPDAKGSVDTQVPDEGVEYLRRGLEPSFTLLLDTRTGRITEVRGAQALQQEIYASMPSDLRARAALSLPELASDAALCETLNGLVALHPPPKPVGHTWKLTHEVMARAGGQSVLPDIACEAKGDLSQGISDTLAVAWEGKLDCQTVLGPVVVEVHATTALAPTGRQVTARLEEVWSQGIEGRWQAELQVADDGLEVPDKAD